MLAEKTEHLFKHREVIEALIKYKGLHEGIWMLTLQFGLSGGNIGESEDAVDPAAIVGIKIIGLTKVESLHPLALDAATVNPAPDRKGSGKNSG